MLPWKKDMSKILEWHPIYSGTLTDNYAQLGVAHDGVRFELTHHPTCYRRGPWKLFIDVCGGENHHKWGCFDSQDQPIRWFHSENCARTEADLIANVLLKDREKYGSSRKEDSEINI